MIQSKYTFCKFSEIWYLKQTSENSSKKITNDQEALLLTAFSCRQSFCELLSLHLAFLGRNIDKL